MREPLALPHDIATTFHALQKGKPAKRRKSVHNCVPPDNAGRARHTLNANTNLVEPCAKAVHVPSQDNTKMIGSNFQRILPGTRSCTFMTSNISCRNWRSTRGPSRSWSFKIHRQRSKRELGLIQAATKMLRKHRCRRKKFHCMHLPTVRQSYLTLTPRHPPFFHNASRRPNVGNNSSA